MADSSGRQDERDAAIAAALASLPVNEHGPAFWARLEEALESTAGPARPTTTRIRSGGRYRSVVAAIALVLVVVMIALTNRPWAISSGPADAPPVTTPVEANTTKPPISEEATSPPDQATDATGDNLPFDIDGVDATERVSQFTTVFDCCQDRVVNIHRIADIVQGSVIAPGETFSLNDVVGERTEEAGFVGGQAIVGGNLELNVGAGVGQFATTLFNAALLAGADIVEHQAHDVYLSRYPLGRDATVGWPEPDLVFANPTEHDFVIWSVYTETEINVSIYSRPGVAVDMGEPVHRTSAGCDIYTTNRIRSFHDGRIEHDQIVAAYRTEPGVDCGDQSG